MSLKKYVKRGLEYVFSGVPIKQVYSDVRVLGPSEMLANRNAVVTGGTSGIGMEIAKAFVRAGAEVVITGRNKDKLEDACRQIENCTERGKVKGIVMNNIQISKFPSCIEEILSLFDSHKIDILVNNAGLVGGDIRECTEAEYDSILDTNLKGSFFLAQIVGKYMKENNIHGNILNIGSSSCLRPAVSAYTLSKWGIRGLTLGLAKDLAPYSITVNGIAPGPTATPMLMKEDVKDDISFATNPIGRFALPEEIANMAVFLTSEMGRTIVGDMIYMTGGAGLITFDDVPYIF